MIIGDMQRLTSFLIHRGVLALVILAAAFSMSSSIQAQTVIWDGSIDTDWSADPDSTSWGGGVDTIFNDGDAAQFNGAGAGVVNITGNVNPSSVSVTSGNYDFTDGGGSIGGAGTLNKSGGGDLQIRTANSFTGGVNLSGGTLIIRDDNANEQSYLGAASNTLTFTGNATLHNQANTITLPQNITVNGGVTGTFTGAFAENIDANGVLAGSGDLIFQGFSAGPTWDFLNTANTFTGSILAIDGSAGHAVVGFSSLPDSPGPTTIGLASDGSNGGQFEYKNAIAPLVLNNRQFELVNNGNSGANLSRQAEIRNNASIANTITINSDLLVTGTGNKNLVLGGSNTGDNTFAGTIPNAIGGDVLNLFKQDGGTWVLSGTNTYLGNTNVDQGNLTLASSGSLLFEIGANGVNNQILGDATPGTLDLQGAFAFDLTGADPTVGNTWDIVDSSILSSTTFGPSFSVDLFTDAGSDLWTLDTVDAQFQFDETTGVLSALEPVATAVPEPASIAIWSLLGLGLAGFGYRRVRRKK